MKKGAVLTEDGAFALFFSSPPRGIWQLKSSHPWVFAIQGKKNANARGSAGGGGWAQVELTDALQLHHILVPYGSKKMMRER